jgi:large subunit ribosomal protein L15
MQLNQLKSKKPLQNKKRRGRGGKKGTYSGRGVKGQKSRAGSNFEPMIRPLIKRYHKKKGIGFHPSRLEKIIVQLEEVENKFSEGETVNSQTLKEKKIISFSPNSKFKVKILSSGELTKKLTFENCQFSKAAREQIEKAGGQIKD